MSKPNTVIITGAAGTIGRATAQLLSQKGCRLLLVDKKEDELIKLTSLLPNSTSLSIDVTDSQAVENLFDSVADDLLSVVLAAGIEGPVSILEDCSDHFFQTVMTTNVMSVWLGIKHALRVFKPRKQGNIVVLSSISGVTAMPMLSPYCASKHAVTGLVRTAAREAASYGIRVNAVCPGPVASTMMERIDSALAELYPARLNGGVDASRSVPMQRYATPEEVANIIGFLCSDASAYCTGTTMMVDGGLTCK
jgi:NAD(P)-dependent dehydrogenase (short-subunit alcohol dehydrogenase family)